MKHSSGHTDIILLPPSSGPNINIPTSKSAPLSLNCLSYNLSLFSENFLPLLAIIEMQLSPENALSSIAFSGDGFLFLPNPPPYDWIWRGTGVSILFSIAISRQFSFPPAKHLNFESHVIRPNYLLGAVIHRPLIP